MLNERRLAYEGAAEILRAEQPAPAVTSSPDTTPTSTLERITLSSLALRPDEARAVAKRVEQAERRVELRKARWSAAKKRAAREKKEGKVDVDIDVQAVDAGTVADRAGVIADHTPSRAASCREVVALLFARVRYCHDSETALKSERPG